MQSKSFLESKTLWVNFIVALLACWDQFAPFLPEKVKEAAIPIIAVINLILRFTTHTTLTTPKADQ